MLEKEILRLKALRRAMILAHNYQPGEVLEIADLCGDSLELSEAAAKADCDLIVFCGVRFMAETAAVLSPDKIVVLPQAMASCPMAEMITAEDVRQMRKAHPDAAVVCYVNSPAEVKAQSDICCTSANGIAVVNSLQEDEIIFVPDRNLAAYVAKHTKKKIIPWHGYCYVHEGFTVADVELKRRLHPHASLLVHPECRPEVIELADYVYSTSGMARHVKGSKDSEFIIGTETGMLYRLWKDNPNAVFVPLSDGAVCADMKKTTLESVLISLERLEPRIRLPPSVASPARRAIARMLEI